MKQCNSTVNLKHHIFGPLYIRPWRYQKGLKFSTSVNFFLQKSNLEINSSCVANEFRLQHSLFPCLKMYVPITKNIMISWVFGSIFGVSVSLLLIHMNQNYKSQLSLFYKSERGPPSAFQGHAHSHKDLENVEGPDEVVEFHNGNTSVHKDEDLVAREMAEKVRVLCWVMTQPKNHKSKV